MPTREPVAVAKVPSERRTFVPIGLIDPETVCRDLLFLIPGAGPFQLGVLASTMHNSWVRYTCGRLESRYRCSAAIVDTNFALSEPSGPQCAEIEAAAQRVLDVRAQFPGATLADLYDLLTMPPALVKAYQKLDAAVDAACMSLGGKRAWRSDAERVAFLFERYAALTSLLPAPAAADKRGRLARLAAGETATASDA